MLLKFSDLIHSPEFAAQARHPDHPKAFSRTRKLPLPALVGVLVSMRACSQQRMLDEFHASLYGQAELIRGVSDRGFAKARERLHMPGLRWLGERMLEWQEQAGAIPKWHGRRVVAGDGSVLMPAVRACHRLRGTLAGPDQRLFGLYLPGAESMLWAQVYSASESERAMLMEALDVLAPGDVLVLDRGYPASWLVALLLKRSIDFVIRCDHARGWRVVREFLRSGAEHAVVSLPAPKAEQAEDWTCERTPCSVRLVRQLAPNGHVRVLMTNLDPQSFPCTVFGDLYHQRWRIEEAFKRLKHRLHLEAVSGLSQHALIIDVAAKILADNLCSALCAFASVQADLPARRRHCNRAYASELLRRLLPGVLFLIGNVMAAITHALTLLASTAQRRVAGRSQPRPPGRRKPHPSICYK